MFQFIGSNRFATSEVGFEHSGHLTRKLSILDQSGDLEIQPERSIVEICRAHSRQIVVHKKNFVVQESGLVSIDSHSGQLALIQERE